MLKFSDNFLWGVATSAYQIEGGHDADGKGKCNWDDFCKLPGKIEDGSSGDKACDSYHQYTEDVEMIKNLGVKSYRFSLNWARIMPDGRSNNINQAGVEYYNNLINLLLENGIKPCVTLYHFDLPSRLEEKGGWLNPEIVDWFSHYADFCYKTFGDRVKMWITINEPQIVAYFGYCLGLHPPAEQDQLNKPYIVSKYLILAHASAYRKYEQYRELQAGIISIALNADFGFISPYGDKDQNEKAVDMYMQFMLGWFADPIFLDGDFPEGMRRVLDEKKILEKSEISRLPTFTDDEKKTIKGSYDFFALNHYTSRYVKSGRDSSGGNFASSLVIHPDLDVVIQADASWDVAGSNWLYIVPEGLRNLLKYISQRYGSKIPIYITENGCSTKHASDELVTLNDEQRISYLKSYISEACKAQNEDGVNLKGYFLWSLMDNFEWAAGYTERFGIYHVDFNDEKCKRTPKKSAEVYKQIVKANGVDI